MNPITGIGAGAIETGLTRGLVVMALLGLLNAALFFSEIDSEDALMLMGFLTPTVTLVSFFLFSILDKGLGKLNPPAPPAEPPSIP